MYRIRNRRIRPIPAPIENIVEVLVTSTSEDLEDDSSDSSVSVSTCF